jgi:hypothetical protein
MTWTAQPLAGQGVEVSAVVIVRKNLKFSQKYLGNYASRDEAIKAMVEQLTTEMLDELECAPERLVVRKHDGSML